VEESGVEVRPRPNGWRTPSVGAWTGAAAVAVAVFTTLEFTIRQIGVGPRPGLGHARSLLDFTAGTSTGTLLVILTDTFLMAAILVFLAGFRQIITQIRPDVEWIGHIAFGAGVAYVAVTLVGDGMEAGAALDVTIPGGGDPSVIRALTIGHAMLFGAIGCVLTALVSAASGYLTLITGALPRWTGVLAMGVAVANVVAVGTTFGGTDDTSFHAVGGWGTAALATFPWLVWVVSVGAVVIRFRRQHLRRAETAAIRVIET
jgi:hypothetical protein